MAATETIRAWLPDALRARGVKRLLDAPCGDYAWQGAVDWPCAYVGADFNAEHVAKAVAAGAEAHVCDLRADPLPVCDAILSRDFFQHLPLEDGRAVLARFRRTGARWLFATCHGAGANADVEFGGFRLVDMTCEPFNLVLVDSCADGVDRALGVYAL
jgi:hypothetical protein